MKRILVVAPHPDDEIIGVGGTIIKELSLGNEVCVCVVTKGMAPIFPKEQVERVQAEARMSHGFIGITESIFWDYPASMIETVNRYEINGAFIDLMKRIEPNEVYIPHVGDMQKDHQIIAESAMVAMRPKYGFSPKRILSYETLSETGWNVPNVQNEFIPNAYVDISDFIVKKLEAMECYKSQLSEFPDARSKEAIEALARYRGASMNMEAAEAFMIIRDIR